MFEMVGRFFANIEWTPIVWGILLGVAIISSYLLIMKFLEK